MGGAPEEDLSCGDKSNHDFKEIQSEQPLPPRVAGEIPEGGSRDLYQCSCLVIVLQVEHTETETLQKMSDRIR